MPDERCALCFGRGWFLCPGFGGRMTPMACDKCPKPTPAPPATASQEDAHPSTGWMPREHPKGIEVTHDKEKR